MSRQAKVLMADVLIAAGYGVKKVLSAIKYPTIESLSFDGKFNLSGEQIESIEISLVDGENGIAETATIGIGEIYKLRSKNLYSTLTKLQHEGFCIFSVYYSQNTLLRNKYPSISNAEIPVVPAYPTPKILQQG